VVLEGEGKVGVRSKSAEWNGKGRDWGGIGEFIGEEEEEGEGEGIEDQVEVGEGNSEKGTEDLFEGRRKCM